MKVRISVLALLLLAACAADRPLVEQFVQGSWQEAPFRVKSMGGQYASGQATFILRLEDPSGRRLTVEGAFDIEPRAILAGGRWREEGNPGGREGSLSAANVDFFGGQGERPALGGQLTLSTAGEAVYRINLPVTRLSRDR